MILVDTSVWILVFRRKDPLDLEAVVDFNEIVTCAPIVQEVLQGFREERHHRTALAAMTSFEIVDDPMTLAVFKEAAQLYRTARRAGFTARSSVDCLIATCALRHDLEVLHADRDFSALARVSPLRARSV